MKFLNQLTSFAPAVAALTLLFCVSCGEEEPINAAPEVANEPEDRTYEEGFETASIPIGNVFSDADGDAMTYTVAVSPQGVVNATISASTLTITEGSVGTATLTLTAADGNGGSAETSFDVTVNEKANSTPTVVNAFADLTFDEGFGSTEVELPPSFRDEETQMLMFSASSSDITVVTVSVAGPRLTITEAGVGTSTITVTATDEEGASVDDQFTFTVNEGGGGGGTTTCDNDNTITTEGVSCTETATVNNSYSASVSGSIRTITTNGIPNHTYNNQRPPGNDGTLNSSTKTYEISAAPALANAVTDILDQNNRPSKKFGVALNGVPMDPAPAEPFIFENPSNGEYNWDWVMEPNNNKQPVELDCAAAHVQPDGTYHYHGDPAEYADTILEGLGSGTATPSSAVQIGWASDGFPVLYKFGPDASGNLTLLAPSYQLKAGDRPGDGITEPCGEYNGKYTNDYEYVSGLGDLDQCNGISRSITLDGETFDYFYVITDSFPVMPRCISGTPSNSFNLGGGGG